MSLYEEIKFKYSELISTTDILKTQFQREKAKVKVNKNLINNYIMQKNKQKQKRILHELKAEVNITKKYNKDPVVKISESLDK